MKLLWRLKDNEIQVIIFSSSYEYFFEGVKMKNLGIKLFSVLVILLFCLSPLGAIDLNQGDNVTHSNHNGTDIKDVNDTIKDVNDTIKDDDTDKVNDGDIEDKSVNGTDVGLDDDGTDVEKQNVSSNGTNSSEKLDQEYDPALHLSVDDINYGETAVVKMWITNDLINYLDPVTVKITGPDYSNEFNVRVWQREGINEFKVEDLPPGDYIITASVAGSRVIKPTKLTSWFSVKKHKVNLTAQVNDVELGETPVLRVTCDKGLEGNITIYSNWSDDKFTVDASHDSFSYQLDRNMAPGNYYCVVSYSGDKIHDSAVMCDFFTVKKHDPNMKVEVDDIVQGDKIFVKFHANKSLNCDVRYMVMSCPSSSSNSSLGEGSIHTVHLVNGEANASLSNSLPTGNYFISATCVGDDSFKEVNTSAYFRVKSDSDLAPGNYNASVISSGSQYYKPDLKSVGFTVKEKSANHAGSNLSINLLKKVLLEDNGL